MADAGPRLPARKDRRRAALIYRALVWPALWGSFERIALHDGAGAAGQGLATLWYANHVSWWDGYLIFLLEQRWRADFYLMMEEAQLQRYQFFRRCGCFSVDRGDARAGLRSVQYAAGLLRDDPQRGVWIFPQGTITPNDRRPLGTYSGAAHIARRAAPVRAVPVALRFEFGREQRPAAFIRIGAAHVIDGGSAERLHADMDRRLLAEVDQLHADVNSGAVDDYATVMTGRPSVNVLWDRVRGKAAPR